MESQVIQLTQGLPGWTLRRFTVSTNFRQQALSGKTYPYADFLFHSAAQA
jgi:hypothetical protein